MLISLMDPDCEDSRPCRFPDLRHVGVPVVPHTVTKIANGDYELTVGDCYAAALVCVL